MTHISEGPLLTHTKTALDTQRDSTRGGHSVEAGDAEAEFKEVRKRSLSGTGPMYGN